MNNLYRELAPITESAWSEIELEASRTFKRHIAGRRVVDVSEPGGTVTTAISTGHLLDVSAPGDGGVAHLRESKPLVRLRVPFTVSRTAVVFAEFDRWGRLQPTIPFWRSLYRERYLSWIADRRVLPWVYWPLILRGRA